MSTRLYNVVIDTVTESIVKVAIARSKDAAAQYAINLTKSVERVAIEDISYVTVYQDGKAVQFYNLITIKPTPKHEKEVRK